jgi:hypothetical protein
MTDALEILKYTVPALIVFLAVFFIMKKFMDNEYRKLIFELKRSNQKLTTPVRLQAYERAILFLERISVDNLIRRIMKPSMSSKQLETDLIRAIRSEYEHNLSQQLYMSNSAWEAVKVATEELIKIIHLSSAQLKQGPASAYDLSKVIFAVWGKMQKSPVRIAMDILKTEIKQLY